LKLAYKGNSQDIFGRRFFWIGLILLMCVGAIGYQMRHLYYYGVERDEAVDLYELFRQSADGLRQRYGMIRDAKVPWSVRYNDVERLGERTLFLLKRVHTALLSNDALANSRFTNDLKELIALESAYQGHLQDHMNLVKGVAQVRRRLAVNCQDLRKSLKAGPLAREKAVAVPLMRWLNSVQKLLAMRPISPEAWESLGRVPVSESSYKGKYRKIALTLISGARALDNQLQIIRNRGDVVGSRSRITEGERSLYAKLFELSDGVASILTMREARMPHWKVLIGMVMLLLTAILMSIVCFIRHQRRQVRCTLENLEGALVSGVDAGVPEEFLPILNKMREAQEHQITTICVEDKDVEEWFQSVLRYNNEIRHSVIGLRDGIVWQKINSLEPANDDMDHVLQQLEVQGGVLDVLDEFIASLNTGKLSRRHTREIARTLKKVRRFYGDVLPASMKYAAESFKRAEHRMDETVRVMNLLIRAYDSLRECLPQQICAAMKGRGAPAEQIEEIHPSEDLGNTVSQE